MDGVSTLYEDDGATFDYRQGAWMRMTLTWRDAERHLSLGLAPGSRTLPPMPRPIQIRVAGATGIRPVEFTGASVEIQM